MRPQLCSLEQLQISESSDFLRFSENGGNPGSNPGGSVIFSGILHVRNSEPFIYKHFI